MLPKPQEPVGLQNIVKRLQYVRMTLHKNVQRTCREWEPIISSFKKKKKKSYEKVEISTGPGGAFLNYFKSVL